MKKVFLIAVGSMLIYSCNTKKDEVVIDSPTDVEATMQNEHKNHDATAVIALNNNEKWAVNEEMKPYVMKGEELVTSYIAKNQTDYKTLAKNLKEENNKLIKSCTMDGESHDELHKWLHPHLELTKKLESETNAENALVVVKELQKSYQEYHRYFN